MRKTLIAFSAAMCISLLAGCGSSTVTKVESLPAWSEEYADYTVSTGIANGIFDVDPDSPIEEVGTGTENATGTTVGETGGGTGAGETASGGNTTGGTGGETGGTTTGTGGGLAGNTVIGAAGGSGGFTGGSSGGTSGSSSGGIADKASRETAITRSQFITLISRHFTHGEKYTVGHLEHYTDVPDDKYYSGAVFWAYDNGLIFGDSMTEFFPDKPITREDAAATLFTYAISYMEFAGVEFPDEDPKPFDDSSQISEYAREAVDCLHSLSVIVTEKGNNKFQPKEPLTRAEWMAWYARYCMLLWGELPEVNYDMSEGSITVH